MEEHMWQSAHDCQCFFCAADRPHPVDRHPNKRPISGRLLVAESLDPKDTLKRFACVTCGHVTEEVPKS